MIYCNNIEKSLLRKVMYIIYNIINRNQKGTLKDSTGHDKTRLQIKTYFDVFGIRKDTRQI